MTRRAVVVWVALASAGCGGARPVDREAPPPEDDAEASEPVSAQAGPVRSTGGTWLCAWPDLDQCRQRCADGNALSCARLGRLLEPAWSYDRPQPEADPAAAHEAFTRSCELGYGIACGELAAEALLTADDNPEDAPRGRALLARACELEVAWACTRLAHDSERGDSYRLIRRACDLGDDRACDIARVIGADPSGKGSRNMANAYQAALSGGPVASPRAKAVVKCARGSVAVYAQIVAGASGPETYCALPTGSKEGASILWASEEDLSEGPAHGVAIETGNYVAGARNGMFTLRHTSGVVAAEGEYIDDLEVGVWHFDREDGSREEAGAFVAGVRDGAWTEWNGDRERSGNYRAGLKHGAWIEKVDGVTVRLWSYDAGNEDGNDTRLWPGGERCVDTWSGGASAGPTTCWHGDGRKMTKAEVTELLTR